MSKYIHLQKSLRLNFYGSNQVEINSYQHTVPIDKILSVKNGRSRVSWSPHQIMGTTQLLQTQKLR